MPTFPLQPGGGRRAVAAAAVILAGLVAAVVGLTSATAAAAAPCTAEYRVAIQWPGGFLGTVKITNTGDAIDGWTLKFDMPDGQSVRHGWIGRYSQDGSTVTVNSLSWNAKVAPGRSVASGFIGTYEGANGVPTAFNLNGEACDTGEVVTTTTAPAPTTTATSAPVTTTTDGTTATTGPTTTQATTATTAPATTATTQGTTPTTAPATTQPTTATTAPTTTATTQGSTIPPNPTPSGSGADDNLELIMGNRTRNTQFDNNPFRDVPMNQISVDDLTVNRDIYNEGLLNTNISGYFRVKCEVSHFAYDDPIVFPGEPGRAHLHMFFGNTDTNAYSTFDSLLNSGTGACNGEDLNRTAYWIPAMLDRNGNALVPFEIMVYYKNDNFLLNGANELVEPFPDNLRMIAGNGGATQPQTTLSGGPGSLPVVSFLCGPAYITYNRSALIPDCDGTGQGPWAGRALEMQVAFPQCYDPASNTYAADGSHVSYSEGGYYDARCPNSHPYDVSSIMYRIFFNPDDYGGSLSDLHLSSDVRHGQVLPGGTTSHADWFGAWHPEAMDMWVKNCNNTRADCELGLLDRNPAISMVKRKRGFYPAGYRASAEELIKLCPGKQLDPADRLGSVANCRH